MVGSIHNVPIGILALQGDMSLHKAVLRDIGLKPLEIKSVEQLKMIRGLVIPGGESTALLRLLEPIGMFSAIQQFAKNGNSIFGTCAGAILLAQTVTNPAQKSLGLIDVTIERNGYGRQINSSLGLGQMLQPLGTENIPLTFIRAPRVTCIGDKVKVKVLVSYRNEPVLMQQDNILIATFHPELTDDTRIYNYWLRMLVEY